MAFHVLYEQTFGTAERDQMTVKSRIKVFALGISVGLAGAAIAQDAVSGQSAPSGESAQSDIQMPNIQAPARPPEGQQTGLMSGNKPFSLTTDPSGELIYNFDDNNELDTIVGKKGVIFWSEDMTLNSDQLDYKAADSRMVATGEKVIVRQGDVVATCQLFKYFPNDQHSELMGNPLLYNKAKDTGKVSTTAGDKIFIYQVNGKSQVKVFGGSKAPRLNSGQNAVAPIPVGGPTATSPDASNARMINTTVSKPTGEVMRTNSGSSSPLAPPANDAGGGAAGSSASGGGTNKMMNFGFGGSGGNDAKPKAPRSNRIDLDNPEDVGSYSSKTSTR